MMLANVIILLLGASIVSGQSKEVWKIWSQECQEETDTPKAMLEGMDEPLGDVAEVGQDLCYYGHVARMMELLKFESVACYTRCLVLKLGHLNVQNEFVPENLDKKFGREGFDMIEATTKCAEESRHENKCIEAVRKALCIAEAIFCK